MKHTVLTSIAFIAVAGTGARAQSISRASAVVMAKRLSVRPDSKLWLEGSSNVRDWRCEATTLDASIDLDEDADAAPAAPAAVRVQSVHVRVPTHALTCGRSQMDHIMFKALHVDDAPDCRQIVGRFDVISATPGSNSFVMQGTLRIAGRERDVRVPVVLQEQRDGSVRAQGAMPILMTDYGITPPTALFGVLRTENRIVVKFDLRVDRPATVATIGDDGER